MSVFTKENIVSTNFNKENFVLQGFSKESIITQSFIKESFDTNFLRWNLTRSDWHKSEIDNDLGIGIKYRQTVGIGDTFEFLGEGDEYGVLFQLANVFNMDNFQRIVEIPSTDLTERVKIKVKIRNARFVKNSRFGFGFSFENGTGNIAYFGDLGIRLGFEKISTTRTRFFIEHRARPNRSTAFIINTLYNKEFAIDSIYADVPTFYLEIEKNSNKTHINVTSFVYYVRVDSILIEDTVPSIDVEFTDYNYSNMYVVFGCHNYLLTQGLPAGNIAIVKFNDYENYKGIIIQNNLYAKENIQNNVWVK